jgi:WD40 repeat protein
VPVAAIGPDRRAAPEPIGKLLASSRDGRRRLVEQWNDRAFLVTDDRDRVLARVVHPHPFDVAGISPSGDDFAVASAKPGTSGRCEITIHDAGNGRAKRSFDVAARYVSQVTFDPLGRTLLLHVDADDVELRDVGTGRRLGVIHGKPAGAVTVAAYSTDGRFIVTHEFPSPLIHVHDPLTLATQRILDNHLAVCWCRCSPDGRRLLVGQDYANSIRLVTSWDLETGERGWSRCGPAGGAGTFSADGRLYLTHAVDHVWALWDVERGTVQCVLVSPEATPVFGPEGTTLHQHVPDGPRLWPPAPD